MYGATSLTMVIIRHVKHLKKDGAVDAQTVIKACYFLTKTLTND